MPTFVKSSELPAPARVVFAWHQTPGALGALIPPWEPVTVERAAPSLGDGHEAVLVMRIGPFTRRWVARHTGFIDRGDDGGEFTDTQVKGPFAEWVHRHVVRARGPAACVLEDAITYRLPLGVVGHLLAGWYVRRKLDRLFAYRHEATRRAVCAGGFTPPS